MEQEMNNLNFEDALKKLESIVYEMEKGDLKLEDSLKKFEEGIRLSSFCLKELEKAEGKIKLLLEDEQNIFKLVDFKWEEEKDNGDTKIF